MIRIYIRIIYTSWTKMFGVEAKDKKDYSFVVTVID